MKRILNILLLTFCSAVMFSCEKEDRTYNGPDYIEFSPTQFEQMLGNDGLTQKEGKIVGLETFVAQKIAYLVENEQKVNFRVADVVYFMKFSNLYLPELPSDAKVGEYTVEYTAMQEGIDYSFDGIEAVTFDKQSLKGSVAIGSMESFAYIITNILKSGGKSMFIVLEDSDDFIANKYSRILKYTAP